MKDYLHKEIPIGWIKNQRLILILRIASYLALSAILINLSWNAWADIIIDFGQELYISWRMTEGDILYRDIDYFHQGGPVSFFWNILWFKILGIELNSLIIADIFLLALLVFLTDRWLTTLSDKTSSFIAIMFFLAIFAFNRYTPGGNYNYIAPYSISLLQGLIIIIALLNSLHGVTGKRNIYPWLSGVLLGLAIINKIEVAFTAIAVSAVYLISAYYTSRTTVTGKKIATIISASLIPLFIIVFIFAQHMPLIDAIYNIFNQWVMLLDGRLSEMSNMDFYKRTLGTDNITGNVLKLIGWTLIYINIALIGFGLALANPSKRNLAVSLFLITAIFSVIFFMVPNVIMTDFARPLPAIIILLAALFTKRIFDQRRTGITDINLPLLLASFVLAGTFILKIVLNSRFYHYGFILAMPATLLTVIFFLKWLGDGLKKYFDTGKSNFYFRSIIIGLLLAISIYLIGGSSDAYTYNNFICCDDSGIDKIRTDPVRGPVIAATLSKLKDVLKPGQNFTVMPEGVMLNFLLKRESPVPYYQFRPQLFIMYEEDTIIENVAKASPDFIVIINDEAYGYFGKDYGVGLKKWIEENYKSIWQYDNKPENSFTAIIFQINSP